MQRKRHVEILHQNKDFAVVIKPVGLDAEKECPEALKAQLGGEIYPLHRLDKNVGGVMVYARNKQTAAALSRCIQEGCMVKEYVAIVHGTPEKEGTLEDLLYKDPRKNKVFVVNRKRNGVKEARLSYQVLKTEKENSLVQVRLFTGRTHQIRVQFASRGFPLLGDHKYGARDDEKTPQLFSFRISFPWKGETLVFSALPDWAK